MMRAVLLPARWIGPAVIAGLAGILLIRAERIGSKSPPTPVASPGAPRDLFVAGVRAVRDG